MEPFIYSELTEIKLLLDEILKELKEVRKHEHQQK